MEAVTLNFELPKRAEDAPEFWLGQISAIVKAESRSGGISRSDAYKHIKQAMKDCKDYQEMRYQEAKSCAAALKVPKK